ncbi:MAG TPA: exonuclease sbcCD subunit D, partial [Microbacterium sp.]|nr:exonuclease sbcCD subunit D [Microbacterium sp.]
EASVAWLDLPIPRRLVTIRGTLDDLCSGADHEHAANAWVRAEYTDATPQRDPLRRLQERFPFCAAVVHAPESRHDRDEQTYAGRVRTAQTHVELIDAFLAHVREGEGASEAEAALIADVLADRAVAEALA